MIKVALAICALLAFLFPVAVYCVILAAINRRPRPLVVRGHWDTAGLLFACSGFFLVTIPILFGEFVDHWMPIDSGFVSFLLLNRWLVWLAYFLVLIVGAISLMLSRTHKTSIYNVDPALFTKAFEHAIEGMSLGANQQRDRWLLSAAPSFPSDATGISEGPPSTVAVPAQSLRGEVRVESFPAMCHVTLHWKNYAAEVRCDVEAALDKHLDLAAPEENPAAGWFLSVSGLIFGALFMIAILIMIALFFPKH